MTVCDISAIALKIQVVRLKTGWRIHKAIDRLAITC